MIKNCPSLWATGVSVHLPPPPPPGLSMSGIILLRNISWVRISLLTRGDEIANMADFQITELNMEAWFSFLCNSYIRTVKESVEPIFDC